MRVNLHTSSSTKAERRFAEILKRNHIPFQFRVIVSGREIDFILKENIAIEIGDHSQDVVKNKGILESGYSLFFIKNKDLLKNSAGVEKLLLAWIK